MIIDRLILNNFKRFGDADIHFKSGITGIVGGNGTGKSSIVEAVFFALFGVADKSVPSEYVVSSFAKDPCVTYLHFHIGTDRYFIRRTFKKGKTVQHDAQLNYNGEIRASGVTQVEAEVRRILGMGPADFRNTVYAAQKDLLTLLDLTPGKRKEWFLRALGIDYLNTGSQKILKDQCDAKEKEAVLLQGQLAVLARQDPQELEQTRISLTYLREGIEQSRIFEQTLAETQGVKSAILKDLQTRVIQQGKLIDQEDRIRQISISLGYRDLHQYERDESILSLEEADAHLRRLSEGVAAIPYLEEDHLACRQHLLDLEVAQTRLRDLTGKVAEQASLRAQVAELTSLAAVKTVSLGEVRVKIDKDPIDPTAAPMLQHELEKLDISLQSIRQDLATSIERERAAVGKVAQLEEAGKLTCTLQDQLAALNVEIEILKLTRAAIAEYVIYLMQAVRSRIESEVSGIIGEITGGRYDRVFLDEDFNLLVRDADKEFSIDRFSGGEQDDIAVALRIALSRYLAEMHQVHESTLLIFDEIFGSQDEERRNNLLTALRSQESRFPQIILISHIAEVQGEFGNTLVVQAQGDMSTVQEVA